MREHARRPARRGRHVKAVRREASDDAVVHDVDEFDVAAVGLDGGADEVDHALDFLSQRRNVGSGHVVLTHALVGYGESIAMR